MKKVQLNVVFFKKWTLKTTCYDTNMGDYLKRTLKEKIEIKDNRIVSLFNIKINSTYTWLIMDSKNNLLTLDAKIPKKVIIIGIDLKAFYASIIDLMQTEQIRIINKYITNVYGIKLYEDMIDEEIPIKPLSKKTIEEIITPVIIEEKVEIKKPKEDKKEKEVPGSVAKVKKEVVVSDKKSDKVEERVPKKETVVQREIIIKDDINTKKEKPKSVVNNKPQKKEVKETTSKEKENPLEEKKEIKDNIVKKKGTEKKEKVIDKQPNVKKDIEKKPIKKDDEKPKETKGLKDNNTKSKIEIEKPKQEKKNNELDDKTKKENKKKVEMVSKKEETKPKKEKEQVIKEEKKEVPKEIQIVLDLKDNDSALNNEEPKNNRLIVATKDSINENNTTDGDNKEQDSFTEQSNIQRIVFSVITETGEVIYNRVIINTKPMTVEELLKKTGLPVLESSNGFVESIAGFENNNNSHWWVYEVNGAPVMEAASDYIVSPEDQITWKYMYFPPLNLVLDETEDKPIEVMDEEVTTRKVR